MEKSWLRLLSLTILFGIFGLMIFIHPSSTQVASGGCAVKDRAGGLISSLQTSTTFGNPDGRCIADTSAVLETSSVPTFAQLKSTYYDQANPTGTTSPTFRKADAISTSTDSIDLTQSDTVFDIEGSLTLTKAPTGSKTGLIFVRDTLTITKNITYPASSAGLVFIVGGAINIDKAVTTIDAVLISGGTICTACAADGTEQPGPHTPLSINGSLISLTATQPIKFKRVLSNNSQPAEVVNQQPKYIVILKDMMSESLKIQSEVTDYNGQ
jgi:hypothetical protein